MSNTRIETSTPWCAADTGYDGGFSAEPLESPVTSKQDPATRASGTGTGTPNTLPASRWGVTEPTAAHGQDPGTAQSSAPPPALCPTAGTSTLVTRFASPPRVPVAPPPPASPPPASPPSNTATQRLSAQSGTEAPHAAAGLTSSGKAVFVDVALLRGDEPQHSTKGEVFGASVQVGNHTELRAGMFRAEAQSSDGASAGFEVFTARANIGTQNDDGAQGFNIGASAAILGAAAAYDSQGFRVGVEGNIGTGAQFSLGRRDGDADGRDELCAKLSVGAVGGNMCIEGETVVEWTNQIFDTAFGERSSP